MPHARIILDALVVEQSRQRIGCSGLTVTAQRLDQLLRKGGFPYVVIGVYAVQQYGYRRFTEDVDVVVSRRQAARDYLVMTGHFKPVAGSQMTIVDRETGITVDLLPAGRQDSPSAFPYPDPDKCNMRSGIRCVDFEELVALKLSTGRNKDSADVTELAKINSLPVDLMDGYTTAIVQAYTKVWQQAQDEIKRQPAPE